MPLALHRVDAHAGPPASWDAIQAGGSGGEKGRDGGEGESATRARAVPVPRPTRPPQRLRACPNLPRGWGLLGGRMGAKERVWREGGEHTCLHDVLICKTGGAPPGRQRARAGGGGPKRARARHERRPPPYSHPPRVTTPPHQVWGLG